MPPSSPTEEQRASLASPAFVVANVGNLLFFTGVATFFVLPLHLENLGASRGEVGHVMGSFGLTSAVMIPITGLLVDRHGRRPFMLAGALLWVLSAAGFSRVTQLGPLPYALRMLQGVAFALAFVSTNALVADVAPRGSLGRAIAIFGTTTLVTHAAGPTVAEVILSRWGFPELCALSGAGAALSFVAYATLHEPSRVGRQPAIGSASHGLVALALRPEARNALLAASLAAVAFGATTNFMPIYVRARGLPGFSPFFSAYVAAAIAVRLAAGGLGDRLGHARIGTASLAAFAAVVTAFPWVDATPGLVVAGVAFGVAHGFAYPSLNALFVQGAPDAARGRAMALFNLSFNVGVTVAAFAGGELAERFGYATMWRVMGALAALGVVSMVVGPGAAGDRG